MMDCTHSMPILNFYNVYNANFFGRSNNFILIRYKR